MDLESWLVWVRELPALIARDLRAPTLVALGLLLVLLAAALGLWLLARRRLRDVVQSLDDSTRGHFVPTQRRQGLVRGDLRPAPDPFIAFSAELILRGPLGALPVIGSQRLTLSGQLQRRPPVELVWQRGRTPERALGRGPETRLWITRRLDFVPGDYAVRGSNPAALEHAFLDLQTRFGALTRRVRLLGEAQPHLEVEIEANSLSREEIPALITTVRALARAALRA